MLGMPVYDRLLNIVIGPAEATIALERLLASDEIGSVLFSSNTPAAEAFVAMFVAALVVGMQAILALLLAVVIVNLEVRLRVGQSRMMHLPVRILIGSFTNVLAENRTWPRLHMSILLPVAIRTVCRLGLFELLVDNRVLLGIVMAAIILGPIAKPRENDSLGIVMALSAVAGLSTNNRNLGALKRPSGNAS